MLGKVYGLNNIFIFFSKTSHNSKYFIFTFQIRFFLRPLLSNINTLNAVDSEAEFNHVMRIILELEDQDMIMKLFKGLNINSIKKILSMSYKKL